MNALFEVPSFFVFFAATFGLLIGSFLNVVIYRLPKMLEREWLEECHEYFPDKVPAPEKGVFNLCLPRSHCPKCHNTVRAIDNIPVFSWLFLKGKCRHCETPISARYPAIELLTAVTLGLGAYTLTGSYWALAVLAATCALIALCFIDIDTMLLPDHITLPLMWSGILLAVFGISPVSLQDSVMGAIVGYLTLWTVYKVFKLLTGKEGMGYGDFKLLAALGAWLGWQLLPMVILISSLVGAIGGLFLMKLNNTGKETPFPFGPYLVLGGWICLLWGNDIFTWYFSSFMGG